MKLMKTIIALLLSATGSAALPIPKATASAIARAAAEYSPLGRRLTESMTLIKSDVECESNDDLLGTFSKLEECAAKVLEAGGRFFIYGKEEISGRSDGDKTGQCYHEKTSDGTCSEGWESDSYNFYESMCAASKFVKDNKCEDCLKGHTCDGAEATACDQTKYVDSNVCKTCPTGSTCDGSKATKCAETKYVDSNVCKTCPTGFTCDGTKAAKRAPNTFALNNVCMVCPSGYTCDGTAATKVKTAAERAECLAGSEGSCDKCCEGITGVCVTASKDLNKLADKDDCVLLEGNYNAIDATSLRLKRPWLFLASARRVGKRRRRRDRRRGRRQLPLRQRLPRPSGIPIRRRLVRARAARRPRRRFARA